MTSAKSKQLKQGDEPAKEGQSMRNDHSKQNDNLTQYNTKRIPFSVLFDGSFDGFLCIIYAYYYDKIQPLYIQTEDAFQQTLDVEVYYVATDTEKSARVYDGIRQKISEDSANNLYKAFLSGEDNKYMDLFRYVLLGFKKGFALDDCLQEDCVLRVHKLAKHVGREVHLLSGFCRFAETKQGVFYCVIEPKNHVLALLAEHFRDRFMNHAWIIHDKKHGMAAVYNGEDYIIESVPKDINVLYTDEEEKIQSLYTTFFNTIGIKERANYKLQRQHVPLYFRGPMIEFRRKNWAGTNH